MSGPVNGTTSENKRRPVPGSSAGANVATTDLASLFECPVCFDYVLPPILQCQSGHLVCSTCRPKLACCPTCRGPLGNIRNLAMEKVAGTVMFPCKHSSSGCSALQLYADKIEHEEICEYRPFSCPCPGASCKWLGSLDQVMPHLVVSHKSITTLQGEDIVFLATDINLAGAVDWVMMQSCFGHCFMLVLEKQEKFDGHQQFFALVQLIGSRKQAENFGYRLELNRHRRRLTWEATPRSIHEGIANAIVNSDCLVFDTNVAQIFADNGNLGINKVCVSGESYFNPPLLDLRINLLVGVAKNILHACGYEVVDDESSSADIRLWYSNRRPNADVIYVPCEYIYTFSGEKFEEDGETYLKLCEDAFIQNSKNPVQDGRYKIMAQAFLAYQLLERQSHRTIKLKSLQTPRSQSRGSTFIMYNYARITAIIRKFEKGVGEGIYGAMPTLADIDMTLLTQEEEWGLLFNFLLKYPTILKQLIVFETGDIYQHTLCTFLQDLCGYFSVYYQKVLIIQDPKPHLMPIMYARIALITAIKRIIEHGCQMLKIPLFDKF